MKLHKYLPRSIYIPHRAYSIRTSVDQRKPFFLNNPRSRILLLKDLTIASIIKKCSLNAIAILPDHLHLIITVGEYAVSQFMHSFKTNASKRINNLLKPVEPFRWQKSFFDHLIRSENDYRERLAYIMTNPKHHGVGGFTWAAPLRLSSAEEELYDRLTALLAEISLAKKHQTAAHAPEEKTIIQRQIETTDRQIDALVYELYGLTVECGGGS